MFKRSLNKIQSSGEKKAQWRWRRGLQCVSPPRIELKEKKVKGNSPLKSVLLSNQHNSQKWRDQRALGPLVVLGLMEFTQSSGWEIGTRWQGGKKEAWAGRAGYSTDEITARILAGRAWRARDCSKGRAKGGRGGTERKMATPTWGLGLAAGLAIAVLVVDGLAGQRVHADLRHTHWRLLHIAMETQDLPSVCRVLHHLGAGETLAEDGWRAIFKKVQRDCRDLAWPLN